MELLIVGQGGAGRKLENGDRSAAARQPNRALAGETGLAPGFSRHARDAAPLGALRLATPKGSHYSTSMVREPRPDVPLTYREYCYLPDDGRRHELMEGDFYVNPAPSTTHQRVSRRLQFMLVEQLETPGIAEVFDAPVDVILSDTNVVQPDLAVVRMSREGAVTERGIEGPPDLIVEILSPGSAGQDEFLKKVLYAKMGVPEYWLVDPNHGRVTVLRAQDGVYKNIARFDRASTLTSVEFPEIAVPLLKVFQQR